MSGLGRPALYRVFSASLVSLFFILSGFILSISFLPGPAMAASACMVDVHGVDVVGSNVIGSIVNTGAINASVHYELWIGKGTEKELVKSGSLDMISGQSRMIAHDYSFGTGSYNVQLNATADCGAADTESMGHIVLEGYVCTNPAAVEGQTRCDYADREYLECTNSGWQVVAQNSGEYCYNCPDICGDGFCNCGENTATCIMDCGTGRCRPSYLNIYRCLGDTRQRKVQLSDCSEEWRTAEECLYGCTGGECNQAPGQIAGCGVKIKTFDYLSSVVVGRQPYISATVENTGDNAEMINLMIKVGDTPGGAYSQMLDAGEEFDKTFYFAAMEETGAYSLRIEASSSCGSTDAATAMLSVSEPGGVVTPPAVVVPPQPQLQTSVDFFPTLLDINALSSKVIVVDIDSSMEQTFTINVEGAPYGWFEHPGQTVVEMEKSVYIYVTPETPGTYELTVSVTAESEEKDFEGRVDVFVAPAESGHGEDTLMAYIIRQLSAFVETVSQNIYMIVALIIIGFIIILAIARKQLKTEYEDLLPGLIVSPRKTEH